MQVIDPGALLSRSYTLEQGPSVRLRLARRSDLPAIRALMESRGVEASELALSRLLHHDPRARVVMCASSLLGGTETIVGVGAIDLRTDAEVDTLVVDEQLTRGLSELLVAALRHRALTHVRRVA